MSSSETAPLLIDIVSDVVCPWCIVGYKQLEKALENTGTVATLAWHPFELNPKMPAEGQNLGEHIIEKYGTTPEDGLRNRAHLTDAGKQLGFEFNFADDMRMQNTFLAHQLLHWAQANEKQHELKMELFSTYFTHRLDLHDPDVLADAAAAVGLDRNEALAVLRDERFADKVRAEQHFWTEQGIRSVPSIVFSRQHLVSGAQGIENFTMILRQLAEESATAT